MARVVVALGGNAILPKGARGDPEEQWRTVKDAARLIAEATRGLETIITHGNGPQVGYLAEAFESLPPERPRQSLDLAVAMTQGWLGFLIAHSLEEAYRNLGIERRVAAIITRVEVDPEDPAFKEPSKPIGSYYSREEAERLSKLYGWVFKQDPRGGYRRVVPSPRPVRVLEAQVIGSLARMGYTVVAVGGGGIPVVRRGNVFEPVEAVVDKDLASSVLARQVDADQLVILTDVPGVAVNYGKPGQRWLRRLTVSEARRLLERGEFPPGSMGPKVQAAVEFVEATCRGAVIGSLSEAGKVISGEAGTLVTC
jgi:carbamate kinase